MYADHRRTIAAPKIMAGGRRSNGACDGAEEDGAVSAAYEALWLGSVGWAGRQIISVILLLGFIWWCIMNL